MKKIILTAVLVSLSLSACGKSEEEEKRERKKEVMQKMSLGLDTKPAKMVKEK